MFLLKDKSFTRECKKWEHRITIIGENPTTVSRSMRIWNYYGRSNFTGQDCFRNSGFKGTRETASQKEFVTAEKWWNFPAHEIMIQHMKVVGGASIRDTDPSDVNAFSKKPKWGKKRRGRFTRGADSRVKTWDFCGCMHDVTKRENCPAFGKKCQKCNKKSNFANVCFWISA